jgi:hypothetical protein
MTTHFEKLDTLINRFKLQIEGDEEEIAAFSAKLIANPSGALSWGDGIFDAAARIEVNKQIVHMLETAEYTVKDVYEILNDRIMYLSRNPSRSSGQCVNLLARSELAATATAHNIISRF